MSSKEAKKPKRRVVKKAETVREKVEKNTQQADAPKKKPGILRLALRFIGAPFRLLWRIVRLLGRFKIFRFIGYILLPKYVRNSWKELRLVTWPTRRESFQLTLAVIIFSIVFGGLVTLMDYGLDKLFKQIILK